MLVALDGVRWQEIFHGADPGLSAARGKGGDLVTAEELTPNLHALMRRGVALGDLDASSPFLASGPNFVSLPGYTEMLTGRPSPCQENDCEVKPRPTLADAFRSVEGVSTDEVLVLASWEAIGRVSALAPESVVVSTGRGMRGNRSLFVAPDDAGMSPLFRAGEIASPSPGNGWYRPDAFTRTLALARFERLPHPRFAFVGLGDTDEHAHAGRYGDYLEAIRRADRLLGELVAATDAWGPDAAADVMWFVTADHGRGPGFRDHGRSARGSDASWLVAAGGPIPALGVLGATEAHHLRDLAPTILALTGLPAIEADDAGRPIDEIVIGAERALGRSLAPPAVAGPGG